MELSGKKKIESMQSLRGIGILIIFIGHTGLLFNCGELGVSVFFVMSGFLMMYNEREQEECSLTGNIQFSFKRISRLYKLHIITMCVAILLYIWRLGGFLSKIDWLKLGGKVVLNISLLQTWVPHSSVNQSLNGVAWYLSVAAFLYFIFPWVKKKVEKIKLKKLEFLLLLFFVVETVLSYAVLLVTDIESPVYIWLRYYFPVFRLCDFYAGCVIYRLLYEKKESKISINNYGCLVINFAITIGMFVCKSFECKSLFMVNIQNSSVPVIVVACMWVATFGLFDGNLPVFIDNRFFRYIGDRSGYLFLIHYVVIMMCNQIIRTMDINILYFYQKLILLLMELLISLGLTELYFRMTRR